MTPLRKQFTIDDHLGKPKQALSHLYSLDVFEELKQYMEKHNLHKEALSLYQYQHDQQASIMRLYAEYLNKNNRYGEAAIGKPSMTQGHRQSTNSPKPLTACQNTAVQAKPTAPPTNGASLSHPASSPNYQKKTSPPWRSP